MRMLGDKPTTSPPLDRISGILDLITLIASLFHVNDGTHHRSFHSSSSSFCLSPVSSHRRFAKP